MTFPSLSMPVWGNTAYMFSPDLDLLFIRNILCSRYRRITFKVLDTDLLGKWRPSFVDYGRIKSVIRSFYACWVHAPTPPRGYNQRADGFPYALPAPPFPWDRGAGSQRRPGGVGPSRMAFRLGARARRCPPALFFLKPLRPIFWTELHAGCLDQHTVWIIIIIILKMHVVLLKKKTLRALLKEKQLSEPWSACKSEFL